ncbi:sodium channel protein Nach-like [Bombyx mandarina]|uniref:Sodium channel protein Nach-like n=1 Tax=Bombyx mandarina TaxID=7092 RepID=A0A6J2KFH6_BOMMA|nr:sodium channel protein Nach-like [Bombyx mandarina]
MPIVTYASVGCFWALNLAMVLSLACTLTWLLYNRFNEIPTRITIENQYEPVQNLPHPAITICSPNQITASGLKHLNKTLVDGNLTINLEETIPKLLGFYTILKNANITLLAHLQSLLDDNRYDAPEVMGALPQKCDNFLKLCYLERRKYPKCNKLFRPIITAYGICCSFNSFYEFKEKRNVPINNFKPFMIRGSEFHDGLTVVVDSDPENSVPHTVLYAGAIKVMYSDWTEFPVDHESILVEPGTETYHLIHATYTYCSDDVKALPSWR